MIDRWLARVARGPLLLDAALGTRLIALGLDLATDDPCRWNLTRPEFVLGLHRRDVAAGAEAVCTNTFGANRGWLARWGPGEDAHAINRRAVELAREAAGPGRGVIGSIGPTAADDPVGIREQADALLSAGADALVLETFQSNQALQALRALGPVRRPVLVSLFAWPEPIALTADQLLDAGATIVGMNCSADLDQIHRFLDAVERIGDRPCWLKPSAGVPGAPALRPEDFAALARRVAALPTPGLLGGCCGTTDAHLAAVRAAWRG